MSDPARLDSWKEIAGFLGWDVRTVRRWERLRGLPIHRVPGGGRGRVFAYPDELREWLARGRSDAERPVVDSAAAGGAAPVAVIDDREPGRRWFVGWPAVAVAVAAMFAVGGLTVGRSLGRPSAGPRRFVASGRELQALDAADKIAWAYRFDAGEVRSLRGGNFVRAADGNDDVLATVNVDHAPTGQAGELLRFSIDGARRWSARIDDRLVFRAGEYAAPWPASYLDVYRTQGRTRIAWVLHHFTWWPGLLVTFDGRGARLATFVNSGWITSVTQSADRRFLIVAGVMNSRSAYFVAALDAEHPDGHSPEPPGSQFECVTCPAGDPIRYIVFPRSDVSREQSFPAGDPTVDGLANGGVQVQVPEGAGPNVAATIYQLSPDMGVVQARFSDSFWEWHRRLEQEGRIRHTADTCPERRGTQIQSWTRAAGWNVVRVPVDASPR